MFILYSETNLKPQSAVKDVMREVIAGIDKAIYSLLSIVFQLFFSIASADIFSSGMISKFYARIQLVIGVFMMFQLAMTILRGIVNPEGFTDSKSGAGNIIMRICTALVMLSLIVPINLPSASNEFEKQINNNGLLFGTLYSLQYRILSNNTIGKVVMGVGSNEGDNFMAGNGNESFKKSADVFTSTIVKGFYRINLVPEEDRVHKEGKEDDQINENRVCQDIDDDIINEYKRIDADPGTIIDLVNTTCAKSGALNKLKSKLPWKNWNGSQLYAFTIMPAVSSIIGILFVVILLSFCVDVATRAIKLAILRLLAPIPIISYMDPKGGKDEAFNAWTKTLISTYLDLFIRVASVYFVIYMIQEMLVHGITTSSTGTLKFFTVLFIWIALFYFAKEAPKFIKQVIGIKDDGGGGIFSGLGKIAGVGAAGAGVVSGGISGAAAGAMSGKSLPGKIFKGIGGGLGGALGGGVNAGKDLWKQDKPNASAIMAANRARAQKRYANAADESTFTGRLVAGTRSDLGLRTEFDKLDTKAKDYETGAAAYERMTSVLDSMDGVKEAKEKMEWLKSHGTEDEYKAAKQRMKDIEAATYSDIITRGENGELTDARERQVYEAAKQSFKIGEKYANDDDGVYESFKGKTLDTCDLGTLGEGAGNAKNEAAAIKEGEQYRTARSNSQRASDNKKSS